MSSEHRAPAQMPANKLYVNIAPIQSTIFDGEGVAAGNKVAWVATDLTALGMLSTPGMGVLRDMGKTVYLSNDSTSGLRSTVLRKVQLVTEQSVGGEAGDVGSEYLTGYIQIGGLTYGGGNGSAARVARLN